MNRRTILLLLLPLAACAGRQQSCIETGRWVDPGTLASVAEPVSIRHAVVLLGEHHDSAADHAWQLASIEHLYARDPAIALGFEMFPRPVQPVLDHWVAGDLSEAELLAQTDWANVWGFDPGLYMPIFRFARDRHVPMLALNVPDRLVGRVARQGWAATDVKDREGIGTPAPPSDAYRASLADAMAGHGGPGPSAAGLSRFIDAQLVWDRAMAEAIAAQRARRPQATVVALMGAGHVEHGYGVPHQLAALGVDDVSALIPVHDVCAPLGAGFADAVYTD